MYKIPEHVTWKNLDQGFVVLDLRSTNYYTLNPTASVIWQEVLNHKSESEVAERILAEYECDRENCISDIKEQLRFWLEEGLIEQEGATN